MKPTAVQEIERNGRKIIEDAGSRVTVEPTTTPGTNGARMAQLGLDVNDYRPATIGLLAAHDLMEVSSMTPGLVSAIVDAMQYGAEKMAAKYSLLDK